MPYPVAVVEIAFDDGPYVVSPTWTDVTAYVRGMEISRGVNDDWELVASGSASVTLSNRDRRFDPFNTSGPYYGKLLPRRQIRIRATHSATTYDVFRGFVDGWPPQWTDAGYDSTVTLSCFDALQLLGSSSLPADWSRKYILTTNPRHYYPCDEPITAFLANQVIKDYGSLPLDMLTTDYASQGAELGPGLPSRSIQGTNFDAAVSALGPTVAATNFSLATWAIFDGNADGSVGCEIGNCGAYVGYNTANSVYEVVVSDNGTGTVRTFRTTANFDSGTARFFAFTFNVTTKALQLWIDGVLAPTTSTSVASIIILFGETVAINSAQAQCVLMWDSIITETQVRNIYNYSSAFFPETTSARVSRLIAETPYSATLVSTPASPASSVLAITNDSPTTASELGKVALSEFAPLFVSKAGTLTLYQQNQIRTQTKSIVSQQTYGSGGLGIGTEVQLQYDGDSMRNVANVEMSGGGVYIGKNTASVTANGEAEQYVQTEIQTLAQGTQVATIVTGWGGQVYPKVSPTEVVLSPSASWASTLGLELWDRVTLAVAPPTGNVITTPMLVSRIQHSVSPERWQTTLEGSARWAAVFILNSSRLGGTDLLG